MEYLLSAHLKCTCVYGEHKVLKVCTTITGRHGQYKDVSLPLILLTIHLAPSPMLLEIDWNFAYSQNTSYKKKMFYYLEVGSITITSYNAAWMSKRYPFLQYPAVTNSWSMSTCTRPSHNPDCQYRKIHGPNCCSTTKSPIPQPQPTLSYSPPCCSTALSPSLTTLYPHNYQHLNVLPPENHCATNGT